MSDQEVEELRLGLGIRIFGLGYMPPIRLISMTEDELMELERQVTEEEGP